MDIKIILSFSFVDFVTNHMPAPLEIKRSAICGLKKKTSKSSLHASIWHKSCFCSWLRGGKSVNESDSWFETSTESIIKRGEASKPLFFVNEPTPRANFEDEYIYHEEGITPPEQDPNKHCHDYCGDVGLVLTQFAPGEPRPFETPRGLDALRFPPLEIYPDLEEMTPIDAWLGRPGEIYVEEILEGSPAHECGLIQAGDKLIGLRVYGGEYLNLRDWPYRNALEVLVGQPNQPVQLRLQRPWTDASRRRLRRRQLRWEDLSKDDPEIARGLAIAAGERERGMLDDSETSTEEERMEVVDVTLIRRPRYLFAAIANGSHAALKRRIVGAGPALLALGRQAILREAAAAWARGPVRHVPARRGEDAAAGIKAALDAAALEGGGVELGSGLHVLGNSELRVMDGRGRSVNMHVHLRGPRGPAAVVWGQVALGTPMPNDEPVRFYNTPLEIEERFDHRHPTIRLPCLCNAGGSLRGLRMEWDEPFHSCVLAFGGLWRFDNCSFENTDCEGKCVTLTDQAMLDMRACRFAGGCRLALMLARRACLMLQSSHVSGVRCGVVAIDDCAAWMADSLFRGCEQAVWLGGTAQVKAHSCRFEDNTQVFYLRFTSLTGGSDQTINEYAEVDLVGCRVQGRLWRDYKGEVPRVRNFVDVGNEYLP